MSVSNNEQLMIELVNRLRLDPVGEAERLGLSAEEIAALNLPTGSLSPLAGSAALHDAAAAHSVWMIQTDTFSHTGLGGSNAGERMEAAGYEFSGNWHWGENIGYRASSGTLDTTQAIYHLHRGLFLSDGHRANLLNGSFREIGLGQANGDYLGYDATMVTQNFATSGGRVFLTGVAYNDTDGDDFYSVGEGVGGVTFSMGSGDASTSSSGGYSLEMNDSGKQSVTITYGNTVIEAAVEASSSNVKLDLVNGSVLYSSGSLTLLDGGSDAVLLGLADLYLVGNAAANHLTGNGGDNILTGGRGNDTIDGGDGTDTAVLNVSSQDVTVEQVGDTIVITSSDGVDTYLNTEHFEFIDGTFDAAAVAEFGDAKGTDGGSSQNTDPDNPDTGAEGTPGDDTIVGTLGADVFYLGDGNDHYSGANEPGSAGNDLIYLGLGDDTVLGGSGDDVFHGMDGGDSMVGGSGNDTMYGGNGPDIMRGGTGNDEIWGGHGHDTIHGEGGNDLIYAREGNDLITGGLGNDTIWAGSGDDTVTGGPGGDHGYLGSGNDVFHDDPNDDATSPSDIIYLGAGDDSAYGTGGNDIFHGLGGNDLIQGGGGDDEIFGGTDADILRGGSGNDLVWGGKGTDLIDLGAGDDIFRDTWQGGALGQDTITGGPGADTFQFTTNSSHDTITDFEPGIDTIRLPQRIGSGNLTPEEVIDRYAVITADGVVLDFGNGMSITLEGLTSLDGLAGDIEMF